MAEPRFALVVGSQCDEMPELSFLPTIQEDLDLDALEPDRRLVVRLRDLFATQSAGFVPLKVAGTTAPGLLLNPTQADANAVLEAGLELAHEQQGVLLVHFLGHGLGAREGAKSISACSTRPS